jgi:hypothetical protein
MFANILAIALTSRCVLDIAFPDEKQLWLTAGYLFSVLALILFSIITSGLAVADAIIIGAVLILMTCNFIWIPGELGPQLYFILTIFIPIVFLLTLSESPNPVFQQLRKRFTQYGIPTIVASTLWFIFRQPVTSNLADYFNEHPYHVVAQTLAKVGIIFVSEGTLAPAVALLVLALLNVRSALVGYSVAFVLAKIKKLYTLKGAIALVILLVACSGFLLYSSTSWEDIIERIVYRNRTELSGDAASSVSSGRNDIWAYYIDLLMESNALEILFGRGGVWVYGGGASGGQLEAHNDALNLLICYGLFGTIIICYIWYRILARISDQYRTSCIILFAILFLTNGVVFHQSNVLFLLFMSGQRRSRSVPQAALNVSSFQRVGIPDADAFYRK